MADDNETYEQILTDISALQKVEKQLFTNLETNPSMPLEEKQTLTDKMNQLTTMRINMYKSLGDLNGRLISVAVDSATNLKQQAEMVKMVEDELNHSKKQLDELQEEKINNLRLIEINAYFGDKYAEHIKLMQIVIYTLLPIIALSIVYKTGWLPAFVFQVAVAIIGLIGAIFFWKRYLSISMRDNMNYQQYDWPFVPPNVSSVAVKTPDPWETDMTTQAPIGTCVGDTCCSTGMKYDTTINQCVTASK